MPRSQYPIVRNVQDLLDFAKEITRLRQIEDIPDFTNLKNRFVSGRTTDRVPTSPNDTLSTDVVGDIVIDAANGYEYKLVDNLGTLQWDRRSLDLSW